MSELKVVLGENGEKITVGDKVYHLSPLTLGDIADAEEKFGCDLESFQMAFKKVKNLLFLVYLAMREKQPNITPEDIGKLFKVSDMEQLNAILVSILNISGMNETVEKKA